MRRYDDPLEVRKGLVAGCEAPEQFVWRDKLWVVRALLGCWVETGAWWEQVGVSALFGAEGSASRGVAAVAELLDEREVWRVEAARSKCDSACCGVFDLAFSWGDASWRLLHSLD